MTLNEETVTVLQIFICDSLEATIENITIALQCCANDIEKDILYILKEDLEKISEPQFSHVKSICTKYINQHYLF
ncbi:MAG: hypothetical protein IJO36_05290 [Clostridia bacterium]|nr:hypothetical protein [Clostridia bacterium]